MEWNSKKDKESQRETARRIISSYSLDNKSNTNQATKLKNFKDGKNDTKYFMENDINCYLQFINFLNGCSCGYRGCRETDYSGLAL